MTACYSRRSRFIEVEEYSDTELADLRKRIPPFCHPQTAIQDASLAITELQQLPTATLNGMEGDAMKQVIDLSDCVAMKRALVYRCDDVLRERFAAEKLRCERDDVLWAGLDRLLVAKYRKEVERLEACKATVTLADEAALTALQQRAVDKNQALEASVGHRIRELDEAVQGFRQLLAEVAASPQVGQMGQKGQGGQGVHSPALGSLSEAGTEAIGGINLQRHVSCHNGRDAALAIAWLDLHRATFATDSTAAPRVKTRQLMDHLSHVLNEFAFLRQMTLAAKVVAHVTSPAHKKLLNLCHNWISTYLPHCLAKVNRVTFGLLSAEDCKAALLADPHVPRSRLKLAVPFVGKDVPSKASEFAHPDIIIGLTILAYRWVIGWGIPLARASGL